MKRKMAIQTITLSRIFLSKLFYVEVLYILPTRDSPGNNKINVFDVSRVFSRRFLGFAAA